jgi:ATP-binding cassette subfamily A (ABC1) protein 3
MNLLLRQIWALVRKNLLLICVRRPIATFIRAFALPLVIVLVLAYSKNFFSSPQHWGVSSAHNVSSLLFVYYERHKCRFLTRKSSLEACNTRTEANLVKIRSLKEGLAAVKGQDIVGFIDNGMTGGEVEAVIHSISQQVSDAGKTPKQYNSTWELAQDCLTDLKGSSPCYGAVIFYSSPNQGTNESRPGAWNYTIRGQGSSYGSNVDVRGNMNGAEVYLLPLQRELENVMISQSGSNATSKLLEKMEVIIYTDQDQTSLDESRTANYLMYCMYAFSPIFAFALIELVYHLSSHVARERELGMSGLIDTMISGGSNIRGRIVRQISTWLSFAIVYFPSWLSVGLVISIVCFPKTSRDLPVGFIILSGLSMVSYSLFGASFFKKAQLSGAIMIVIASIGSILPIVVFEQTKGICTVLSIIFPTANFTYYVSAHAAFESVDKIASMTGSPTMSGESTNTYRMPLYFHWLMAIIHILVFPPMAFAVEHLLHSTASRHRTFENPTNPGDATVTLTGFTKT